MNVKTGYYSDGNDIWFLSKKEIMVPLRLIRLDPETGKTVHLDTPTVSGFMYLGTTWGQIQETVHAIDQMEDDRSKRDYRSDWNEFLNYVHRESGALTCKHSRYCITTIVERVVRSGTKWVSDEKRREFVLGRIKRQDYFDLIYEFLPDVKALTPPSKIYDALTWQLNTAKIMAIMTEECEVKFDLPFIPDPKPSDEENSTADH